MFDLLNRLGIETAGFDRWGLHWAGAEHAWTWILLALLLVGFIALSIPGARHAHSRGRQAALLVLRSLGLLIVLWCIFQPAVRLSQVAKMQNSLAVLLDTSESMGIIDPESEQSRTDQALELIKDERKFFDELEQDYDVRYYGFDQGLHPLAGRPGKASLKSSGQATEVLESIDQILRETGSKPLAGIMLISDGADNGKLHKIMQAIKDKGSDAGERPQSALLNDFPARINTVVSGRSENFRDLAIIDVLHDEYGFVHNPFEVIVKLRVEGELASQIPLTFKRENEVLATRSVDVGAGGLVEVKLDFTPRQVGDYFFSVEVPVYRGESSDRNNMVRFPLKVLRDKVRVLYIVGNPSWDERFLRRAMKKNPSVDLVCFYIMRERWDTTEAPRSEVSLIPFPTEELFTKELNNFDLIIFQNFYGNEYMPHQYMRLLNEYVKERGGSYLLIGGIRALLGGTSFNLPLQEILPVELSRDIPNWEQGEYSLMLTPEGGSHPIMRLSDDPSENERQWQDMPALDGINRTLSAKPGALVLARHPFLKASGENLPLISVMDVGAGRTMTVATDSSWRWGFMSVGQGKTPRNYQHFWDNAFRWLLKDPEMRQLSLTRDKGRAAPGDKIKLMLEVLNEKYKPTNEAQVSIEITDQPQGSAIIPPELKPAGEGKYAFDLQPTAPGAYRVRATANLRGRSLGHDEVIFEVADLSREFDDVAIRADLLEMISLATGGKSVRADDGLSGIEFPNPEYEKVTGFKDLPLWDNPAVYVLGLLIMGLLWFLRRRWGMS